MIKGGDIGVIKKKDLLLSRTKESIPKKAEFYIKKMIFKKNKYIQSSEFQIYGSFNYQLQPFPGDVDSTNLVKFKKDVSEDKAIKISAITIQNIVKNLSKVKNYTISDLKCGSHDNGEPIHWSKEDILKGYINAGMKDKNGNSSKNKITLLDALSDFGEMCKLDLIAPFMGRYVEITVLYQLYVDGVFLTKSLADADKQHINLLADTLTQIKKGKLFKVIKRLFSYARLTKNYNLSKFLEPFINSNLSKLASFKSDLETLGLIIENNKFPSPQIANDELDKIKFGVDNILDMDLNKEEVYKQIDILKDFIKKKNKDSSLKKVKLINKYFDKVLNDETNKFLGKKGTQELEKIINKLII